MDKKEFFSTCLKEYQFLIDDYGFKVKYKRADSTGYRVLFQNSTTAVYMFFEFREQFLETLLCKLVDGELPEYTQESAPECTSPGMVTLVRPDKRCGKSHYIADDLAAQIAMDAKKVRYGAADVLQGDFSVFSMVRDYMRQPHPRRRKT